MTTYNDLEKRIDALEEQFNGIIISLNNNKKYTDADIDGCRQSIGNITPYTETKTAYIGDTEITFSGVKEGNLSVFLKNNNGDYPNYTIERNNDTLTVYFEPLEYVTTITISIQ